jgi:hypothetical protein
VGRTHHCHKLHAWVLEPRGVSVESPEQHE